MDNNDYIALVQRVFTTEDGTKLLKILTDAYMTSTLIGSDPHATYYLVGKRDLINDLNNVVQVKDYEKPLNYIGDIYDR